MRKALYGSKPILGILTIVLLSTMACEAERKGNKLMLKSRAFKDGQEIPSLHTCDNKNYSPHLTWATPPNGTKSLALICDDPDAPMGTWIHWVIYNLKPDLGELPENVPSDKKLHFGGSQGVNSFRKIGYGGPCPPHGEKHRYFFKLIALDTMLDLAPGATKEQLEQAMKGHILEKGTLMGLYQRKR